MRQTFRDLYGYIKRYPRPFLIGIVALLFSSYFATLAPVIIGNAIDAFKNGTVTTSNVWRYVGALVGVTAVAATSMIVVRRTMLNASWEIQFDIRHDLFERFTFLDANYYDNHRVGDLMARLTSDLSAVRMMVGVGIFQGINTLLTLFFTLYRMANLNGRLTLFTLIIVPFIALSFFLLLRLIHKRYERVQEQFGDVSAMAQENFSGIRVVKGFGIEEREVQSFGRLNDEFIRRNLSLVKVDGPLFPLMELLFGITISALLLLGGRAVLLGDVFTVGEFASFVLLFMGIEWPIIAFGWIGSVLQRGVTSWGRLREVFDEQPHVKDGPQTDFSLRSVKGSIEFRNVSLKFDDFVALDDVSFKVAQGERVGLTGRTGSGKTMIVNLIARLLEPSTGEIFIDGIDIKKYPLEVLRRYIGIVPQEPFLFSDTIAENIAFGIPEDSSEARMKRIKEVAQLVQLDGDIEDFPDKYETSLGERGVTLSGGQRQRTAMARAIIRDPAILILDDALSAVDTQTEALILEGLEGVARGRTTLIVAHRISAFQNADRVLVLEDGRIVEEGTHDALVKLDGWYADMDRRQQLEADLEAA